MQRSKDLAEALTRLLQARPAGQVQQLEPTDPPNPQPHAYPGILPSERYNPAPPAQDPIDEQLRTYLATPYEIGDINPKFQGLGYVGTDMRHVLRDFPDDKLKGKMGIRLMELSSNELCQLGRGVIPMIASGFSKQGGAALFVLAYNARAPGTYYIERLFEHDPTLDNPLDKHYYEYPVKQMIVSGMYERLQATADEDLEAAVYCYIALCIMRVFSKSADNFLKAWNHIKTGFHKFYGDVIDINLPNPEKTVINNLVEWFSIEPRAKQALYRLLYISNANDEHKGLKRFAFEMHLANTGLHIVEFFVALCKHLNCHTGRLLQVLNINEYDRQITSLIAMLRMLGLENPQYRRAIWRYGRIFDDSFMSDLKTKTCAKLVYTLGEALKMEAPQSYANFSQISQLADISDIDKKRCNAMAKNIISKIRIHNGKDSE